MCCMGYPFPYHLWFDRVNKLLFLRLVFTQHTLIEHAIKFYDIYRRSQGTRRIPAVPMMCCCVHLSLAETEQEEDPGRGHHLMFVWLVQRTLLLIVTPYQHWLISDTQHSNCTHSHHPHIPLSVLVLKCLFLVVHVI